MSLFPNLVPTPLKTLEQPRDTPHAELHSLLTIGSHSWMEINGKPTLAIPGKLLLVYSESCHTDQCKLGAPPKWAEPRVPLRVPADKGTHFIDHNGAKCEEADAHRLAPLFQSVEHCSPKFDFKGVNLVCNRNNIRNLLRWLDGTTKKDFRIDLHLVNNNKTIVMQEYEIKYTEEVNPSVEFRGFGVNFRAKVTSSPIGQTRHNRVVNYVSLPFSRRHAGANILIIRNLVSSVS
jgi:hypothetical protein